MPFNVKNINLDEVSFVGKGANQGAHVILMKRDNKLKGVDDMTELEKLQKKYDDLQKSSDAGKVDLEKMKNDLEVLEKVQKELDELKKKADVDDDNKIDKSKLSTEMLKRFEDQETEIKKQAIAIAKMEDERLEKHWVTVASAVEMIGKADDIGKILKTVAQIDNDVAESIFTLFKAADNRIRKGGMFKEYGSNGEGNADNALDQLNKKAREHAKDNKVTFEKAFTHVYATETDLRKQYLSERS